jgi:alpha-glucosidase
VEQVVWYFNLKFRNRFMDPSKMFKLLLENGIQTVANVKPWLLLDHPDYEHVKKEKGLVWNNEINAPSTQRLWSSGI